MTQISLAVAKAHLSAYARRVEAGETLMVLKHNRPAFVMMPAPTERKPHAKKPGLAKGKIHMAADFDPTPEAVIRDFEGTHEGSA